jgi:predicted PurR-regulated permease PerM
VALISLAAVALVASFAWVVVPKLVTQVGELADGIPGYIASLQRRDDVIGRYFREQDFSDRLKDFVADLPERISSSFDTILGVAKGVGSTVFNVLTVAILAIYFMVGLPQMRRSGAILFDPTYRERAEAILDQAIMRIGGYVAGILTTASIAGISALVFLSILNVIGIGVPFALPLSIFSALMGLIPAVGAYIGAAPAVLLGYIESPLTGTVILVYFIVYQQIENYVIQPRVMKDAVNLSPAAVVVSTLIFGSLGGVVGALLALPAAATIKVVFVEVVLRSRMEEGDTEAAAQLREHLEAEAEAKAEAQARAESRRRWFRRIKERLGPRKDDSST